MTILLCGGGLDSMTILAFSHSDPSWGGEVSQRLKVPKIDSVLWVDYGQAASKYEKASVQWGCLRYGKKEMLTSSVTLDIKVMGNSPKMFGLDKNFKQGVNKQDFYVRNRNLMLCTLAIMYSDEIIIGAHAEPKSGAYPDAKISFFRGLEKSLNTLLRKPVRIHTPLQNLDSYDILDLASRRDPELVSNTHSCCVGIKGGCHQCGKCKMRDAHLGFQFR